MDTKVVHKWALRALIIILMLGSVGVVWEVFSALQKNINNKSVENGAVTTIQVANSFGWPVNDRNNYGLSGGHDFDITSHADFHPGLDWNRRGAGPYDRGDSVFALANGYVEYADWVYNRDGSPGRFGRSVLIRHPLSDNTSVWSFYAHLELINVVPNDPVAIGEKIGEIGDSGCNKDPKPCSPHLHWEIRLSPSEPGAWPSGHSEEQLKSMYAHPEEFITNFNFFSNTRGMVILFEGPFFQGERTIGLGGFYSFQGTSLDNKISSIAIPPGYGVTLYQRSDGKISVDGTEGKLTLYQSQFRLEDNEFSSGENADHGVSSMYVFQTNCTDNTVSAANTQNCEPPPLEAQPGIPPQSAPPMPNLADVVGITFFREKNFSNQINKLGYGQHDFSEDFLSVRLDNSDMHFTVFNSGGGNDCFDSRRLGDRIEHPSFIDHGDWWHATTRIKVEYGSCPQGQPPAKRVAFYREKNFSGHIADKPVGFNGGFTDNYLSVRLDEGISYITINDKNESRCWDKWDFDGRQENASIIDHGDWWQNTVSVMVQNTMCPPHDAHLLSPLGNVPYNTDVTLTIRKPEGGMSVYGELWGLSTGVWYFNQPVADLSWHVGVLPPGQYTMFLRGVNDYGRSNATEARFTVLPAPDCDDVEVEGVVLFDSTNCAGEKIEVTNPGWSALTNFDNLASSVFIKQGWSVEVVDNSPTTEPRATCLTDTQLDLSYTTYRPDYDTVEGTVSTIKVHNAPNCGKQLPIIECHQQNFVGVVLFDYRYCLGEERLFASPGFYNLYDFAELASSIHVQTGWSVRVYQDPDRGGHFACFNDSKWDLSFDPYWHSEDVRANNDITSIEVFNDTMCGWPQQPQLYLADFELNENVANTFHWENVFAGNYWVELWGSNGYFQTSGQLGTPKWQLATLPAGEYVFKVRAEVFGQLNEWSEGQFTVLAASTPIPTETPTPLPVPTDVRATETPAATNVQVPTVTLTATMQTDVPTVIATMTPTTIAVVIVQPLPGEESIDQNIRLYLPLIVK